MERTERAQEAYDGRSSLASACRGVGWRVAKREVARLRLEVNLALSGGGEDLCRPGVLALGEVQSDELGRTVMKVSFTAGPRRFADEGWVD